jgi:hypothetical protein
MPGTFAVVTLPLLAVLALSLPGMAVAGPPDGVSGKMVLDQVADGLRRYRKESDEDRRLELLNQLAPSRDPRVAIALGEFLGCAADEVNQFDAALLICRHYGAPLQFSKNGLSRGSEFVRGAGVWWEKNEADLRRRARQLPQ